MRILLSIVFTICACSFSFSQTIEEKRPKLVVGIVVDQMRYDYLTRFYNKYADDGFRRLLTEGFSLENAHFSYIPTYTAPGHASIYTGTTPSVHGIIGNNWYDKELKKEIYCVDDTLYKSIGSETGGQKSPRRMLTTTITDELKLAQNRQGKVIALSIKDRSAVLPGGHTADAAYWFAGANEGNFITSSFYMDSLPKWVTDFNSSGLAKRYMNTTWNTLKNIDEYTESMVDDNKFEGLFNGKITPTFPYNLKKLKKKNGNYDLLKEVPFGNSLVKDFAEAAIIGERLGKGIATDFLSISFSSTDYVGHKFGPDSKEIEDTYIRLDRDLASFLAFLDEHVGKDNYTLFLTADHAVTQVPSYLNSLKIPAGYFNWEEFKVSINTMTQSAFQMPMDSIIENVSNNQVFLNAAALKRHDLKINEVSSILANGLIKHKNIYRTITANTLNRTEFSDGILHRLQNGYNQKLSGDVLLIPNPSTIWRGTTGTTHGSGYNYDSHVPILFYGKGIKKGTSKRKVAISDIAPTLSNLLKIGFPNGATGTIIEEVFEE